MTPKDLQRLGVIFIPWCAGASRDERLVRKRRLGGSRGKKCRAGACPQPWVGRAVARSRRARVRKCPPELSLRRKPESRRGGIPQRRRLLPTKNPVRLSRKIFILLCGLRKAVVNPALGDPKPGGIHQAFTRLLPRETSLPCGVHVREMKMDSCGAIVIHVASPVGDPSGWLPIAVGMPFLGDG